MSDPRPADLTAQEREALEVPKWSVTLRLWGRSRDLGLTDGQRCRAAEAGHGLEFFGRVPSSYLLANIGLRYDSGKYYELQEQG